MCVCARACVRACVSVCEREGERENARVCVCVWRGGGGGIYFRFA